MPRRTKALQLYREFGCRLAADAASAEPRHNLILQARDRGDRPLGAAVIASLNIAHQAERVVTAPFEMHLIPLAGFTGLMAAAA